MNATADVEIGQRLQQVREQQKLSQAQAVRALGEAGLVWSQGTLSKVESGTRPVRLAELPAIARALGVSQSELLAPEDPLSAALERMKVVESTAHEAYSDIRFRYLSAAATRRGIQLLIELAEGRPGPFTVSCSSARFLRECLRDEFSDTQISPEVALASLGVEYSVVGVIHIDSEEEFDALISSLPDDYKPLMDWGSVSKLRKAPLDSGYNSLAYIQGALTDHAMGKALEAAFPQVTFTAASEPVHGGFTFKEKLMITGIREPDRA